MYKILFTQTFLDTYKKLVARNAKLKKRVKKTIKLLSSNPFYPSLKTHRVLTRNYGFQWSSWATEDIRIIWNFSRDKKLVVELLDIGKHSGKKRIYR